MSNNKFPTIPKELLEELELRFPDHLPMKAVPYEDYILRQGQITVIRLLRHQYDLQNQNILEN